MYSCVDVSTGLLYHFTDYNKAKSFCELNRNIVIVSENHDNYYSKLDEIPIRIIEKYLREKKLNNIINEQKI